MTSRLLLLTLYTLNFKPENITLNPQWATPASAASFRVHLAQQDMFVFIVADTNTIFNTRLFINSSKNIMDVNV